MTMISADRQALVEVRNLVIGYEDPVHGDVTLVDDVSFDIARDEVFCIVGESGSGKSLTMSAVMGLLPPGVKVLGGSVLFDGVDVTSMSAAERRQLRGGRVGIVFQDPMTALNPVLSIRRQIARMIRLHQPQASRAEVRRQVVSLLESVGVADPARRARSRPHEWSGGMRQRAMIAMATANSPDLLIADEPTTALDVTIEAQVMAVLARARRPGTSMALITHDLGLVAEHADRVAVMYSGRIVEMAGVFDIFETPRHPYTRALLATILSRNGHGVRAMAIEGLPPAPDNRPPGCAFEPRCELSRHRSVCRSAAPALEMVSVSQVSACHFNDETAGGSTDVQL